MKTIQMKNMNDNDFRNLSGFIYARSGISLSYKKKQMLSSRLRKRLNALEIDSFNEYYRYISESIDRDDEIKFMLNAVTTNKTDFFRESSHFDFLRDKLLPEYSIRLKKRKNDSLLIWSAGCSTGEEPYTLAMICSDFFTNNSNRYKILASDISTQVLLKGKEATYSEDKINAIPLEFRKKYLLRGINGRTGLFRIIPDLRKQIEFRYINLMDYDYRLQEKVDIIFCRNVIIYFDKKMQYELFEKFYKCLSPGGFLFVGHSESLNGVNDQFQTIIPTIYQKPFNEADLLGGQKYA